MGARRKEGDGRRKEGGREEGGREGGREEGRQEGRREDGREGGGGKRCPHREREQPSPILAFNVHRAAQDMAASPSRGTPKRNAMPMFPTPCALDDKHSLHTLKWIHMSGLHPDTIPRIASRVFLQGLMQFAWLQLLGKRDRMCFA